MANPEERSDDRPELPTRVPFAGPHPGTIERDWRSPAPHIESPPGATGQRSRTSLPRALGVPRQRSILADAPAAGPSQGSSVQGAEPGPVKPATTAEPGPAKRAATGEKAVAAGPASPAMAVGAVRPPRSRVLPVAVAASILVAGALWWSQEPAAPSAPQLAPTPTAAPTMRITAPGADASAGVGSDTASTKSASDTGGTSTGGPASSGGSPAAASPAKSVKPSPNATAAAAVNTSGRNLALGAQANASSIEGDHWAVANAVDGDLATRWSSQFSDPQWFMVDLGKRWEVSEILLHWENAHATAYQVEISTDGKKWQQVYSTTQGQGGDVTVQVPKTPAQQIRMYGTKRSTDYGYSLLDVEVR